MKHYANGKPIVARPNRASGADFRLLREDRAGGGLWPSYRDGSPHYGGKAESITCDAARPPKALAAEIVRRLLPVYDAAYAKALAWARRHERSEDEADLVAARIASAIGGRVGSRSSRRGDGVPICGEPEDVHRLIVQPATGFGSGHALPVRVDFQVNGLDPETAARVLEIIARLRERHIQKCHRLYTDARACTKEALAKVAELTKRVAELGFAQEPRRTGDLLGSRRSCPRTREPQRAGNGNWKKHMERMK